MPSTTTFALALTALLPSVANAFFPGRVAGFRYPVPWPLGASMAEQVLKQPKWPPEWPYTDADFSRMVSIRFVSLSFACTGNNRLDCS